MNRSGFLRRMFALPLLPLVGRETDYGDLPHSSVDTRRVVTAADVVPRLGRCYVIRQDTWEHQTGCTWTDFENDIIGCLAEHANGGLMIRLAEVEIHAPFYLVSTTSGRVWASRGATARAGKARALRVARRLATGVRS